MEYHTDQSKSKNTLDKLMLKLIQYNNITTNKGKHDKY